jgi:hypothetical protein
MESVLFPLLLVVFVALGAYALWPRPGRARGTKRSSPTSPARRTTSKQPKSPLAILESEVHAARLRLRAVCDGLRDTVASTIPTADRLDDDHVHGHVLLALDVWAGRDFTLRNRAVGLGWLPFIAVPEHQETDETRTARLDRVYRLTGGEQAELAEMRKDRYGQFAYVAGVIAARIHAYPAWALPFFDERHVRLDLAAQVTAIAKGAASLQDHAATLGPAPSGHLRQDPDVVGVYIEKARSLDRRADSLVVRLQAFADYCSVVAGIQEREEKRAWMDRVGGIDDFDGSTENVVNDVEAKHIREMAGESEMLAELYLDTLAPLTASLTVADMGGARGVRQLRFGASETVNIWQPRTEPLIARSG